MIPASRRATAIRRQDLTAEKILKHAFLVQQQRVDELRATEKKLGIIMPSGHREITALIRIGEALSKCELGANMMRGKNPGVPPLPPIEDESEITSGMRQFDTVDRNLIRETTREMIGLFEEVSGVGHQHDLYRDLRAFGCGALLIIVSEPLSLVLGTTRALAGLKWGRAALGGHRPFSQVMIGLTPNR
jgi:hypothetical protein